ncbi:hypothetical protein HFO39_22825 [Rhizobium leguminosarum]|uniref:hypothetical protein n=1 Tax=Rhizobium leguminosarum TaxID=384 RepID=UPI001C955056|nr:hypothetical protein [Rhizobium leguminosarum]MBY5637569.1 hypothetical protein [Rhizobium leguminosarum]
MSQRFYENLVEPILKEHFPDLSYTACRIGLGSEVLGYDTEISADHDYGPCLQVILAEERFPAAAVQIMDVLDSVLPATFEGWAVHYPTNVRPPKRVCLAPITALKSTRLLLGAIVF